MSDLIIKTSFDKIETKQATDSVVNSFQRAGELAAKAVENSINNSILNLKSSFLKFGGILAGVFSTSAVISAAQIQEDAVNRLNTALALTGRFSKEVSESIQSFAAELQKTSKFGDELILKNASLIQSIAKLDSDGLKRATKAAADLSSALGIEFERASLLVARASEGMIDPLKKFGIVVSKGKDNVETFQNVLQQIENRFGGAAQAQIATFSGAIQQLKNSFGDVLESIGFFITKSPTLLAIINQLTQIFANFSASLTTNGDIFAPIISSIRNFVQILIELDRGVFGNFIRSVESVISSILSFATATLGALSSFLLSALEPILGAIDAIAKKLGSDKLSEGTSSLLNKIKMLPVGIAEVSESLKTNSIDTSISNSLSNSLLTIDNFIAETQSRAEQISLNNQTIKNNTITAIQEVSSVVMNEGATLFDFFESLSISFSGTAESMQNVAAQLRQAIQQNLARGISGGIQNIIQSIAAGENAFANFGKFFLNTIGDLAIQMGQVLIGAGIGINSLNAISGAGAIAAGAGLVALGAIIKAIAGGGGKTSSTTSTGGNNFAPMEPATNVGLMSDPNRQERKEERASINLTIQGDVLDSDESGLRIAKLISQAAGKTGVVLRGATYA